MTMPTHAIGSRGLTASILGLGTMGMTYAYGTRDDQESMATVRHALDLGVTMFDTSDVYGPWTGEEVLGRALKGRRDEAIIGTKGGGVTIDDSGKIVGGPKGDPAYLRTSIEGSLRRLGTDHIDLYYLHRVDPNTPIEETFGVMGELVAEGKVRYLGISEASAATIRAAHAVAPLSAVQTEYSLFTRNVEVNGVLATARELGIGFVAYSPAGRGFLTGRVRTLDGLPADDFRVTWPRLTGDNLERNMYLVDRLVKIAERQGITAAQLALAWVLHQGAEVTALTGTKRRTYLDENVAAAELELSAEVLAEVSAALPVGAAVGERYDPIKLAAVQE
jgi:aryl-alcohol dehydrogenase-like predicted oxidoreductase